MTSTVIHPASYRDPSGHIFTKEETIYRQVNLSFKDHFDHFIQSGCYRHLVERGLLIPHEQINANLTGDPNYYTTLKPEAIRYISYPYEWSFDMLKDAALLTLQLIRETLQFGMILKDATPYNVQWHRNRFIFIDTLSFEKYEEKPWIAYRQFCETFLGPLLLMHYSKQPLQQLQLSWPDGIPLTTIHSLLPKKSRWNIHVYVHIHLHAKISAKKGQSKKTPSRLSRQKLLNLISSLELLLSNLHPDTVQSTWSGYYKEAAERMDYLDLKKEIITGWIKLIPALETAADLGANEGEFSRLLAAKGIEVMAADFDPYCINNLYNAIKKNSEKGIQPLIIDLANPSPAIGINNKERASFIQRTRVDMALALALVHHLAIGKNIPFARLSDFFSQLTEYLIIEFIPIADEKVQLLVNQKPAISDQYNQDSFELAFKKNFIIEKQQPVGSSGRLLYLMKKKQD